MILCCGEALIDMIPTVDRDGAAAFAPHPGGAVFNTAVALGRLGAPTGFLSGLSTDLFGEMLASALAASHVDASMALLSDRPTTLAFVKLTDGEAAYSFYDENTAGRLLDPAALPDLPTSVQALFFGGISLIGEPAADFYAALARREAASRVVMLDPNIRESFIDDVAQYRTRLDGMIAIADIVKVSDKDLDWIMPGDLPLTDKAARLLQNGPKVILLTRGAAGASALGPSGGMVDVSAESADVVDTVGAGDSFNAGILARLLDLGVLTKPALAEIGDDALADALAYGARVAAITVSRSGANPPWAHELAAGG